MLLSEAKELLRNNGYRLVKEVYDAVRDHQLTKKNGWKDYSDGYHLEKGISEILNSKKILNKLGRRTVNTDNFVENKRGEEIFKVVKFEKRPGIFLVVDVDTEIGLIGHDNGEKSRGSESGKFADVRIHDDYVNLYLISEEQNRQTVLDTEKFDVRNVPSMISWIIKTLKNF